MRNYAQIIRALRTDHDMSQTQLAELLGTTKNQLGKYHFRFSYADYTCSFAQ